MKRLSVKKILFVIIPALVLGFIIFQLFKINQSARKTLADERARLIGQNRVPFEKRFLTPHFSQGLRIRQNTNTVRDFIKFQDSYYAATTGGLVQFSVEGKLLKHFTVLDGLPESDLTCLTIFNGKLYIGTQTKNLVSFDGEKFENYVWIDRQAQMITSFLENNGKLLIGTSGGGLIEFDGKFFTEIKADQLRISNVNFLFKDQAKLFVGTFDNGLWINENNLWTHFTTADKLPSNRIVGICVKDKKLFVATDFGLAMMEEKSFRSLADLPALSSLVLFNNQIFLTADNGEIFTFENILKEFSAKDDLQNSRLISTNEKLWLLSNQGLAQLKNSKLIAFGEKENDMLTDNFVSALAFDARENLWVGTFRHGIDVFAGTSQADKKLRHLETENIREINYLEASGETISAAASSGLLRFKSDFSSENLTKKDGLPSDSITHFSGDFIATAKGLAFRQNERLRVLSTVQGLPSNSIYTTLQINQTLYAGTLGGLAKIENGRVVQVFKDSNSKLTTNWVTALCYVNERLFIGTYGGGVFELAPSGEIRPLGGGGEASKFTVNPNAFFSDGERLYAGTLTGVKILDLQTQDWKTIRSILPAETILSVTGNAENVYFGTTNGIAQVPKNYFRNGEAE